MRKIIRDTTSKAVENKVKRMIEASSWHPGGWKPVSNIKYIVDEEPYYVCVVEIDDEHPIMRKKWCY